MQRFAIGFLLATLPFVGVAVAEENGGKPSVVVDGGSGLLAAGLGSFYYGHISFEPDQVDVDDARQSIFGGRIAYAFPLARALSVQLDAAGEANISGGSDNDLTEGDFTLAAHVNLRDPAVGLIGLFAGGGRSFDNDDNGDPIPFWFVGGEAQYYIRNVTLGGQIGFLDARDHYLETINDATFVRGSLLYYIGNNTKLSGDLSYLHGTRPNNDPSSGGVIDITGWGLRADHRLNNSQLTLNAAYSGFDYEPTEESDAPWVHEVRVGFTISFGSQTLIDNDRRGAGADLAPINRWISTATNEIE